MQSIHPGSTMVLLAMPTPRRPLGLLPAQTPPAPTPSADSTFSSLAPDMAPTSGSTTPSLPAVPARSQGQGQGQQLLSPVIGLLRAATASPVAAAAAAAAAVHALTSAAASATSPNMFAGGVTHGSSSTSSSRQRLRTFSATTTCAPSPLMGLADDLVHALLHAGTNSAHIYPDMLGARSRTASLDHAGAVRTSALALSAVNPPHVGASSRPNAYGNPDAVLSPQRSLPVIASPPARVAAPAPPSAPSSLVQPLLSSWAHEQQQHQRQLPTPTLHISRGPHQHQQKLHVAPPMQSLSARSTRLTFPIFGRKANNKHSFSPVSKGGDDDNLHLPTKPLGLLARSSIGTYHHTSNSFSFSTCTDFLDLGYLADSEHDPASSFLDHSPLSTPRSILFSHPSPASSQVVQPLLPLASRAATPALILPPPVPIPSSSVHNPSSYPHMPSSQPSAPSLVCPQPTRATPKFQFAVVPAYDPTRVTSVPSDSGASASASFGAEAFPVIAPSPAPPVYPTLVDAIKTPPRTFVMHPPSPISRPGHSHVSVPLGPAAAAALAPPMDPSPVPKRPIPVPRLVAPRPVRALPASAAAMGVKSVLANGLPPRTSPVSPMVLGSHACVLMPDVGKFGG